MKTMDAYPSDYSYIDQFDNDSNGNGVVDTEPYWNSRRWSNSRHLIQDEAKVNYANPANPDRGWNANRDFGEIAPFRTYNEKTGNYPYEVVSPDTATSQWSELDMSGMGLRSLSPEIGYYQHITALYIHSNRLTFLPQQLFLELRQLTILDASYNHISSLPAEIGQSSNLRRLFLTENRITELPIEMGRLFRLEELNLEATVLQGSAESIIAYLRDRMPADAPPPERKFISYLDGNVFIPERERLRVLTYNILAESYASFDQFQYCPSWILDWNYRKQGILKELLVYDCDILCLQEVEAGQFTNYFEPNMSKAGYTGVFAPKSRARTMEDWSSVDGCAIFYKSAKFVSVEQHVVEFQSIAMAKHKEFDDSPDAFSRLITKDNIALIVILQLKEEPSSPSKNGKSKARHVLISNTHIHWNPENRDVKVLQVAMLLEKLSLLNSSKSKWHKIPMVVCGDFNSSVDSAPYELVTTGKLPQYHEDLETFPNNPYYLNGMQHSLRLASAYAPLGEPAFTNYTGNFVGVLDYLFFTSDSLAVSKVLQPVDEEAVRQTKLPNAFLNSDHTSILSEYYWKKR